MKCLEKHIVPENSEVERFRTYAQSHFKSFYPSNKSIKKAIDKGLFTVNGQRASTADLVKDGDVIELWQKEAIKVDVHKFNFTSIYEDDHCLIIHKAPGIPIHSRGKFNISHQLQAWKMPGIHPDELPFPQPLHRLDAATEGLLLCAKSRSFQVAAGRLFEQKKIEKRYTAIVLGKLEGKGTFTQDIDGRAAVSTYNSRQQREFPQWGWLSLVHLYPHTGRTHQLRIHCAVNGYPILGERKYASEIKNLRGKGLFLFADQLVFIHPLTNKKIRSQLDLAQKFSRYF